MSCKRNHEEHQKMAAHILHICSFKTSLLLGKVLGLGPSKFFNKAHV